MFHFQSFNEKEDNHIRFLTEDHKSFNFCLPVVFKWERGARDRASWLAGVVFTSTLPESLWKLFHYWKLMTALHSVWDCATSVKGSRLPVHSCSVVIPQGWWCWCSLFLKTQRDAVGCVSVGCIYRSCVRFPWSNAVEDSICFAQKLPDIRLSICTELLTWWTGSNDLSFNFTAD